MVWTLHLWLDITFIVGHYFYGSTYSEDTTFMFGHYINGMDTTFMVVYNIYSWTLLLWFDITI